MLRRQFKYNVFTCFKQFYLQDEKAEDYPLWAIDEDYERLLSVDPGIISVGTISDNKMVSVIVEIAGGKADEDMSVWDQVNECTLGNI